MRTLKRILIVVLFLATLAFGTCWVLPRIVFRELLKQIDQVSDIATAQAAGRDLAILCQTCLQHPDWFADEPPLAPGWTPQSVLRLDPSWVNVSSEGARAEFGGGFHHFGYGLSIADPSTGVIGATTWVLNFYSEDRLDQEIGRFTLTPGDALTEEQFVDRTMKEFDQRISAGVNSRFGGRDDASLQRCQFAIKHNQIPRLLVDVRSSARNNSDAWRDVLLAFAIDFPTDPAGAAERLRKWARGKDDFSAWLLAAYAFAKVGNLDAAGDAAFQASQRPADDPSWTSSHARYRAHPLCHLLCRERRFKTCAALCNTLVNYTSGGDDMGRVFVYMRDACRIAESQTSTSQPPECGSSDFSDFDPFAGFDIKALVESARATSQPAPTP